MSTDPLMLQPSFSHVEEENLKMNDNSNSVMPTENFVESSAESEEESGIAYEIYLKHNNLAPSTNSCFSPHNVSSQFYENEPPVGLPFDMQPVDILENAFQGIATHLFVFMHYIQQFHFRLWFVKDNDDFANSLETLIKVCTQTMYTIQNTNKAPTTQMGIMKFMSDFLQTELLFKKYNKICFDLVANAISQNMDIFLTLQDFDESEKQFNYVSHSVSLFRAIVESLNQ